MSSNNQDHDKNLDQLQHHHILPQETAIKIGVTLLILTVVTVGVAQIDLGHLNFPIAMLVATIKGFLVAYFFMNLKDDSRENAMIFVTSFVFLSIFMILSSMDLFFRGDVYVKGSYMLPTAGGPSKYKKPWVSSPELLAHGKELFIQQCTSCHGLEGKGNGPASSALNPHPRNFTSTEGWINGRKATMVFKTLKEGLPPSAMASYATLPVDDRWALVHYVLSLGGPELSDTAADFAKVGLDPTKDGGGGEKVVPTIPLEVAMDIMTEPEVVPAAHLYHAGLDNRRSTSLYDRHCTQCHGLRGSGGIKVDHLGGYPLAYVVTRPFRQGLESLRSEEEFSRLVVRGLPGSLMPGLGQLSTGEIHELYEEVKGYAAGSQP